MLRATKANSGATWVAPPRFLYRKYNVYYELSKLSDIKSFLDVGCGAGAMACAFANELGLSGRGVDYSDKGIKNANQLKQKLHLNNVEFIKLEAQKIPASYKSDLVTCFEVLEHVKDDESLLKQLVRLSNRYVIFSVPAKQRLFSQSDTMAGHYRRYEKKLLISLLESNNLRIVSFISYGYPYTNLIRIGREFVAKRKAAKDSSLKNMDQRSKKSGVDLLDVNKFFSAKLPLLVKPTYVTSRLFNRLDLSEGYLVVCEKSIT